MDAIIDTLHLTHPTRGTALVKCGRRAVPTKQERYESEGYTVTVERAMRPAANDQGASVCYRGGLRHAHGRLIGQRRWSLCGEDLGFGSKPTDKPIECSKCRKMVEVCK